ncbi:MAG TPA: hypothetical protein PKD53_00575 [Chloroflexaceae bacterium]|nr:hypothetical protein [Chloroflexaceae bacterium]
MATIVLLMLAVVVALAVLAAARSTRQAPAFLPIERTPRRMRRRDR